jgi:two-component system, NarL family, nitrate/nitrite response regulator NarL
MTLRVLVVSDVKVVQEGLLSVLTRQAGVEVIGTTDMRSAQEHGARLCPDVVLVDATRRTSIERVRELVTSSQCRVVAFGVKETGEEVLALAAAGTAGYVRECAEGCDIVEVLERVMRDELPCSARAAASLYRQVGALSQAAEDGSVAEGPSRGVALSRRELQIAYLIDRGLSNKQIGRELGIEPTTVKNHVHNMCEKLNVHRRGQAAARLRALLRPRSPLPASVPDAGHPAPEAG